MIGPEIGLDVRRPAFVTLRVASLDAALEAWHGRLGLPIKLRAEGYAELQTDTFVLALVERDGGPEATVGFEVGSVEDVAANLMARGFSVDASGSPSGAGTRRAFVMSGGVNLEIVAP